MFKKRYALEAGAEQDLELEWGKNYNQFVVRYQNQEVARFDSNKEIIEGRDIKLNENVSLHVRLVSSLLSRELHVLKDGVPIPGSPGSKESELKEAFWTLAVVSVLNFALGLASVLTQWEALVRAGVSVLSIVTGVILGALAILGHFRKHWVYLAAAALFLGESAWGIYSILNQGLNPNIGSILIRIMIVWTLWRGWTASSQKARS